MTKTKKLVSRPKKTLETTSRASTTTAAIDYFTEENARIDIVSLSEHEIPSFTVVENGEEKLISLEEFIVSKPSYEEVFAEIDARISNLANNFREKLPDRPMYIRLAHRQGKLIQNVGDQYIAVASLVAMVDPAIEPPAPIDPPAPAADLDAIEDLEVLNGKEVELSPEDLALLTFGDAIEHLRQGAKITRLGWTGLNFVYLCQSWVYVPRENALDGAGDAQLGACFFKYSDGVNHAGWLPNFEELTTKTWIVVK